MKTPEEIIKQYSPNPTFGYGSSWIREAMKEYAKQWVDITSIALSNTTRWGACVEQIKQDIDSQ